MKDILYFNTLEDIKIVDMLRTTSKEKELPNLIILTILSAGAGLITPIFLKEGKTEIFASIDDVGTKFILDNKEIPSDDFLVTLVDNAYFGLQFEDSKEHILKVSLTDFTIRPLTFFGNAYLKKVTIGTSITSIGNYAFEECGSLTEVTIPNSVTSIGLRAFSGCSSLTSMVVESGNTIYDSRNNCNAIIETATNTLIYGCKNTIIPNSVTVIGSCAFADCSGLTSVTIPNSVTTIGISAFSGCSGLTSVTIGNSVTSIGNDAFWCCSGLTEVTIPNSVTSIGECAFGYCTGLASITSLAATAPTIQSSTFQDIKANGTLHVPAGSGYSTWMSTSNYYLGKYNWIKVEDALSSAPSSIDPLPLFPPDDAV